MIVSCGPKGTKVENPHFTEISLPHANLYVYNSGDVMGDASYIVEGKKGLVTLETPLFKEKVSEFEEFVKGLKKPVVAEIADFHVGGTYDRPVVMAEGMGTFTKEGAYDAMMAGFQQSFGDSMVELPTGEVTEVPFGETAVLAGVNFKFNHGSVADFPGAAILIDSTALLTHWAPAKSHMNNLQLGSAAAVDAELNFGSSPKELQSAVFPDCPIRNILSRFTDKWTLLTLYTLERKGTLRFVDLYRSIPDISRKMLTTTLKALTDDGFLTRTLYPEVPPRVEYSLTDRARSVMPYLDGLLQWPIDNFDAIMSDRKRNKAASFAGNTCLAQNG